MLHYVASLAAAILLASTARADIVPIFVTGTLDTISDDDAGAFAEAGVGMGSTITGTFWVDTSTSDTNAQPLSSLYPYSVMAFELSAGDWSIEATSNLFSSSTVEARDWPAGETSDDQPYGDTWALNVHMLSPIVPDVGPHLQGVTLGFAYDPSGNMLDDAGILPSGNLLVAEPFRYISFAQQSAFPTGDPAPRYYFVADSFTVPEPSVFWLGMVALLPFLVRSGRRALYQ